ncbi:MAG: CRISPR-associated helicase Cas3' [Xenococcaceae cyanobacterium]
MSKSERQYPYNFGRVFFPSKSNPIPAIPKEVRFQPLGNHVGNVIKLVEYWNQDNFRCGSSFERVKEAAKIHDKGKPQKFELRVETTRKGKFKKYIYSFRGHRYLAESKDAWVEALAKGHHDFSVGDISRDTYELKKNSEYKQILTQDPLAYGKELYILEMCDQIEAELACRAIGDDNQAESRTFMDYTIAKDDSEANTYRIEPWIFSVEEIELTFQSWSLWLSDDDKAELQKCLNANQDGELGKKMDRIAKKWWQDEQGQPEKNPPLKAILKPYSSRDIFKNGDCQFWYQQLANFKPNPMQGELWDNIAKTDNPAILLKAPTGSGKFEAVLFPALAKQYRLILPLPARSLLEDQKQRAEKYLKQFSQLNLGREVSLVLDTGSQMRRWVYRDGEEIKLGINPRRHLYKGDVILTTLDKFLYRYFAYGDQQKSFVFPLRINQQKTLICFDEAHSYDDISFTNFHSLVQSLYEAERSLVLMTATMPPEHIERFDYLDHIDYVDDFERASKLSQLQPSRGFECLKDIRRDKDNLNEFHGKFSEIILQEWNKRDKTRIIAVVETVKDAAAIYQKLKAEIGLTDADGEKFLFLYHGRIADQLRPDLYKQIQNRDTDNKTYILITTSAIEVGCDLNCEVLISQICPPENLIQRIGRCNRKGDVSDAKGILIGNEIPEYINTLDEPGWKKYQKALLGLNSFEPQIISDCISRSQQIDDYRVVELFSMLHEYVYQADLTCQPTHKRGLIPTRSWTPSVNLVHLGEGHSISVPIDRFCNGNQYADVYVYEKWYDQENTRWHHEKLLGWGSAYGKEITVRISPDGVDVDLQKYEYDEDLGFVEIPKVFAKKWTDGADVKLLYVEENNKAVVTYTKSFDEKMSMIPNP